MILIPKNGSYSLLLLLLLLLLVLAIPLVRCCPFGHINHVPQHINSRRNGKFREHGVESSLGSLVLSSVHSTIIITNALINQARR